MHMKDDGSTFKINEIITLNRCLIKYYLADIRVNNTQLNRVLAKLNGMV